MMTTSLTRKLILGVALLFMGWLSVDVLLTKPIPVSSTTLIKTNFWYAEEHQKKGGLAYYIYTKDGKCYGIGTAGKACFNYEAFFKNVKEGTPLTFRVLTNNGEEGLTSPVGLIANNTSYLTLDCTNENFDDDKKTVPVMCLAFSIIAIVYYLSTQESSKRK